MTLLEKVLREISEPDRSILGEVKSRLDNLTKPVGSLGRLEEFALRYCLARGEKFPSLGDKVIFTFAADHGVAAEGVSAYPSEVTAQMVMNMLGGGAGVNVLARHVGARVYVVDIGVNADLEEAPGLLRRKIRRATGNIAEGPAMSVEEAVRAVEVGVDLACRAVGEGATMLGTGDMGIGNTTPSSALFSALIPAPVEKVTGRGTGIDDQRLAVKVKVVKRALDVNADMISEGPMSALAAVGGLEIAGIVGLILGAAWMKTPVVVDGFISTAAALVAMRLCPAVKEYAFFSHLSEEAGHGVFFEVFGEKPILDLSMRLGEGTGAALAMGLIEAGVKVYREMATFDSAGVSKGDDKSQAD